MYEMKYMLLSFKTTSGESANFKKIIISPMLKQITIKYASQANLMLEGT